MTRRTRLPDKGENKGRQSSSNTQREKTTCDNEDKMHPNKETNKQGNKTEETTRDNKHLKMGMRKFGHQRLRSALTVEEQRPVMGSVSCTDTAAGDGAAFVLAALGDAAEGAAASLRSWEQAAASVQGSPLRALTVLPTTSAEHDTCSPWHRKICANLPDTRLAIHAR